VKLVKTYRTRGRVRAENGALEMLRGLFVMATPWARAASARLRSVAGQQRNLAAKAVMHLASWLLRGAYALGRLIDGSTEHGSRPALGSA
jgi:hypothetical protein